MPCRLPAEAFWGPWKKELEKDPDRWFVRAVDKDLVWVNKTARNWTGVRHEVNPFELMMQRFIHPDDWRVMLEFHREALRTGKPQAATIRFRANSKEQLILSTFTAERCQKCQNHCSLVVSLATPFGDEGPSKVHPEPASASL